MTQQTSFTLLINRRPPSGQKGPNPQFARQVQQAARQRWATRELMRGDLYARITWFHAEKRTQDVDNIVHDVSIREIQVGQEGTFVTGDGLLRIILPAPGNVIGEDSNGSVLRENFPFHFALTLDGSRRIAKANFAIDTSDWED